jgi:hypothetical protein
MVTFFSYLFIIFLFFFTLIKEKKWVFDQKARKPLILLGFLVPTFVFKSGQMATFFDQIALFGHF